MASNVPKIQLPEAPPSSDLQRNRILEEILNHCDKFEAKFPQVSVKNLKSQVLQPVLDETFDPETQIRGILRTIEGTDHYKEQFSKLSPSLQASIRAFSNGESPAQALGGQSFKVTDHKVPPVVDILTQKPVQKPPKKKFSLVDFLKSVFLTCFGCLQRLKQIGIPREKGPTIYENDENTKVMKVRVDFAFENWGLTVQNKPKYTFLPTTVLGIQNLVKWANANNRRVRCAGYRHSWAPVFGQDEEVLLSFVNLEEVTTLPDPIDIEGSDYTGKGVPELKTIELKEQSTPGKRLCRVGAAVTSEDFRRWQVKNNWVMPFDTILVEVVISGVTQGICHGAGRQHNCIPDLVRTIEYVDVNGNLQKVSDKKHLQVAAGHFGLLGIVTHVTFELDAMSWAVMEPRKIDVGLAVPPINKEDIPPALRQSWWDSPDAEAQLKAAAQDFDNRTINDYYTEYMWMPFQLKTWVNTWNNTDTSTSSVVYPDDAQTFFEWIQGWLGGVLTSSPFFQALPGYWQAQLMATFEMAILPPTLGENASPTIKTQLPNALHYRRGVQNMRVTNLEFQVPLPPTSGDATKPDMSIARKAWWDVINLVYETLDGGVDPSCPMRLLMEMRVMGSSNIVLAPQYGNTLGTVSMGVLSLPDDLSDEQWMGFLQKLTDKWLKSTKGLNVRPHLAKEWVGLKFNGVDALDYLKQTAYKDQIELFKEIAKEIGTAQGWTLGDIQKRFSNELWDKLIFA